MTERRLDAGALVLAAAGAAVAAYLTWAHFADASLLCATSGCETVQRSEYAELLGVPVALLGLLHYSAVGALVLLRRHAVAAVLAGAGLLFALYLLVIQVAVIDAVCSWCVANDVIAGLLAAVLVLRVSGTGRARAA